MFLVTEEVLVGTTEFSLNVFTEFAEFSDKKIKNKSCVMITTAGYVIMYIQNDVMMFKNVI